MAHNLGFGRPSLCAQLVGVRWEVREDEAISHNHVKYYMWVPSRDIHDYVNSHPYSKENPTGERF